MARLSVFLPPFSPDYSGVASAFFDLNAIAVLHDASGCTGNYTGYDEPRWFNSHSPVYCSGLREIDAILGNDEKLIKKVLAAQEDIKADMIAIIGSPVPMVVGCDSAGIATEIESISSIPSFGFDTTGTEYYDKGISMAAKALIKRFTKDCPLESDSVNILGFNAIDFPLPSSLSSLIDILEGEGIKVRTVFPKGITLEGLETLSGAAGNIVVSASGLEAAQLLESRFSRPYVIGLPFGEKGKKAFLERVKAMLRGEESTPLKGDEDAGDVLILGEAVNALSLGEALRAETGLICRPVSIFTPFKELCALGCGLAASEKEIREIMKKEKWKLIIADPTFKQLLWDNDSPFFSDPVYSVSSKLYLDEAYDRLGSSYWEKLLNLVNKSLFKRRNL